MGEDKFTISLSDLELDIDYVSADSTNTITLDSDFLSDSGSEYTYNIPGHPDSLGESIPFENTMPSIYTINDMVKHYPSLAKAYENFKTIYKMVEQDYKGNIQDKDEIPF
tara:strand:+ start:4484 stop:4813 length:330 start_codon:yes stop_codon:yes gene_type:complete